MQPLIGSSREVLSHNLHLDGLVWRWLLPRLVLVYCIDESCKALSSCFDTLHAHESCEAIDAVANYYLTQYFISYVYPSYIRAVLLDDNKYCTEKAKLFEFCRSCGVERDEECTEMQYMRRIPLEGERRERETFLIFRWGFHTVAGGRYCM